MSMTTEFAKLESKARRARITIPEMLEKAGVPSISYWRAKKGKYRKVDTTLLILRRCEDVVNPNERQADEDHGKVGSGSTQS